MTLRVIIPDSHGAQIDIPARDALLADLKRLDPNEIIWLGDHVDCSVFSRHKRTYTNEMEESYEADYAAMNGFLNLVAKKAPRAKQHYIEGNHEAWVEKWAVESMPRGQDARALVQRFGPPAVLELKRRGIKYYLRSEHYMGISIHGTIKLGKCFFTHGIGCSRNAAHTHLDRFGANVVFGHIHRSVSVIGRSVTSEAFGAWSPGTLAKIQPLWRHTTPTDWTHGYAVQFIAPSGRFVHVNVPIYKGKSLLMDVARRIS